MGSSYQRKCRDCGRRIQLRKMPAGQWVAFEGYNTQHNCKRPPRSKSSKISPSPDSQNSPYDSLGFMEGFSVGGATADYGSNQERPSHSEPAPSHSRRNEIRRKYPPGRERRKKGNNNPAASSQNASPIRETGPQADTSSQIAARQPQTSSKTGAWLFIIILLAGLAYYIFSSNSKKEKPAVESPTALLIPNGVTATNQSPSPRPSVYVSSENSGTKITVDTPSTSLSISNETTVSEDVPPQNEPPLPRIYDASEPSTSVVNSDLLALPSPTPSASTASIKEPIKDQDSQLRMNVARRLEQLGFAVDWQSHSFNEMSDWELRINVANRLRRMGLDIDWQKYSFSQMSDWALRIGIARRLTRKGLDVDWQKHSFSEMSDWELRVGIAERLKQRGVDVNWRDYTFAQLSEMENRIR